MEKQNFLPGIPILATSHDFPISPALALEQSQNLDNTGFIRSDKILIMPDRPMPSSSVATMMTSSNGNISVLLVLCAGNSPVTVEFPSSQRPGTWSRSFDVFFDLRPNKRLGKQWRRRCFEMPLRSLWRNCNDVDIWPGNDRSTRPNLFNLNFHKCLCGL